MVAIFLVGSFSVQAHPSNANPIPIGPLVPECRNEGLPAGACSLCDLFHLAQHVMNFLTLVAAPILVMLMVIIGGFFFLTSGGDPGRWGKGKDIIFTAVIGYVIVLTAWLVIGEILRVFANQGFGRPWEISC